MEPARQGFQDISLVSGFAGRRPLVCEPALATVPRPIQPDRPGASARGRGEVDRAESPRLFGK